MIVCLKSKWSHPLIEEGTQKCKRNLAAFSFSHFQQQPQKGICRRKIQHLFREVRDVRHVLDTPTLFTVINSLVFSSLFYCSSVWSGTCKGNIAKLQLVQNFAARLLSGKRKFDHITPTLKQLKILPVSDLLYIRDAVQMYKCMNNLAPSYLSQLFTKRSQTHSFLTRNRDSLQLPRCRTALAQQSFVFRGVTIWNSLPEELRNCSSIVSFKHQLKSELLSKWLND